MLIRFLIILSLQNVFLCNYVQDCDQVSFKKNIENLNGNFVKFYASWCSQSKEFSIIWNEIAEEFNKHVPSIHFARVDCTLHFKLCHEYDITGYPTLLYFHKNSFEPVEYNKTRDLPSLSLFLNEMLNTNKITEHEIWDQSIYKETKELNDNNIEKTISEGQHFIMFYTPWCRASQSLAPVWSQLSSLCSNNTEVRLSKVNCMDSDATCKNFDIKQYPSMLWFVNGRIAGASNATTIDELKEYVKKMVSTENHDAEKYMRRKKAYPVTRISDDTLEPYLERDLVFVNFIAPWCAHCMQQSPLWSNLGVKYENETRVLIADVDCTRSKLLCETEKINNLPTLILYKNKMKVREEYGTQPFESLVEIVEEHLKDEGASKKTEETQIQRDEL